MAVLQPLLADDRTRLTGKAVKKAIFCGFYGIEYIFRQKVFSFCRSCYMMIRGMQMDKEKEFPQRKRLRLQDFDYSSSGAYFVTICTKNRKTLFAPVVGADSISARTPDSISARMVERTFLETIRQYNGIDSPIYVVMPNHFHAIITISRADMESANMRADIESAPTVSEIIQSFKRYSTIEYSKLVKDGILPPFDKQIWQRSFYDHVIRNRDDYNAIYKYIYENPAKWQSDRFYDEF